MKTFDYTEFVSRTSKVFDVNKLLKSKVAVIGCGGVGSFSAEFLVRSSIGNLLLVDGDVVSVSNLARQNFLPKDVGKFKVDVLKDKLRSINNRVNIFAYNEFLNEENAQRILKGVDILLNATDTLKEKKIVNYLAKKYNISIVTASAFSQQGEIIFTLPSSACIECVYPNDNYALDDQLENKGVSPMVPTILGLIASNIILNYLSFGTTYENKLFRFDFKNMFFHIFPIKKNPKCRVCSMFG